MNTSHRHLLFIILSILLILGLGILWYTRYTKNATTPPFTESTSSSRSPSSLMLAGKIFSIEIARSQESHVKGLSGRTSLAEGTGMLFWFTRDANYPFWMPDMHFAIDILWIDKDWQVVHIEEGVSPESYPATFTSPTLARYVLELPAGTVERIGAKIGEKVLLN
jgi:uncharacterized membrane protein (UPF0127 family)